MESASNTNNRNVRLYYLGSGSIGVPVLQALLEAPDLDVAGVGTQPDRPAGRSRKPNATAVARTSRQYGIPPDKPDSVNADSFLERLGKLAVDLVVVMAFGQLLKPKLLKLPSYGCLNVHASLLPRHRGASPIQHAILAGDRVSGVSFMQMNEGLDTGPVYEKAEVALTDNDTAASLELKLAQLAGNQICDVVRRVVRNNPVPAPQDDAKATRAPKLSKSDGCINWQEPADLIERKIRAFTPWPRAFFFVQNGRKELRIQIVQAEADADKPAQTQPGEILQADNGGWVIACGEGSLRLKTLIPSGKSEMAAAEFLRGTQLQAGDMVKGAQTGESPNHETIAD